MRLRRSDLTKPGILRRRHGRGYSYRLRGRPVGRADRERINALAIPPAWTDVWISPDERGHIQATGIDAAGRRQYLYHDQWRAQRDQRKFAHLADVARRMPVIRKAVAADLASRGLTRRRVLAAAVRLLDRAAIRVGGEAYAVDDPDLGDATFGLATLRRDHVTVHGTRVRLTFPAKGGTEADLVIDDDRLAAVVRALLRRQDDNVELFGYRDGQGWADVHSADINDYLRQISGIDLTAKDFRTWHGTVAATVSLAITSTCRTATARRRAVTQAMRDAATVLGNTPAVARASYVDPHLIDRFTAGDLPPLATGSHEITVTDAYADPQIWNRAEKITTAVLTA